ncbi:Uncharacterised protein [Mycobacterium tuberculosis]|nr:Uncharacterised protein [Mycobacterium tuberculosis]COW19453.1 Uncharacterised protein [Mycobacterium tuberculosis]
MLGDGQQLHMGKPLIHNVIRQLTSKLAVAESRPPRTEMDFVGAHRLVHRVAQRTPSHPVVVTPGVVTRRHPRCGLRRHLGAERERVGPIGNHAVGAVHAELVQTVAREVGPEQFPYP